MCGRYTLRDPEAVAAAMLAIGATPPADPIPRRYNTAPTQVMPVVVVPSGSAPQGIHMRWGIVPFYARNAPKPEHLFNARSETAAEKVSFRQSVQKRRCLVPADGFFEWRRQADGSKTPFFIRVCGEAPFWIAGIFEEACLSHPQGYALLTTGPNELMAPIHDRMPVILPLPAAKHWLAPGPMTQEQVTGLCGSYPAGEMVASEVSSVVNNARNDAPACVTPRDSNQN